MQTNNQSRCNLHVMAALSMTLIFVRILPVVQSYANFQCAIRMQNLGCVEKARGNQLLAERYLCKSIDKVIKERHSESVVARSSWLLAEVYKENGRTSEAKATMRIACEWAIRAFGKNHFQTKVYQKQFELMCSKPAG